MECGKYDYRIQPGEVDLTQRASIITLGDHILHAAGEDADRLGFGLRWMQSNNTTWVLSRMAIEMERYPDEYETYQIETWVSDVNRLMSTRNFILYDMQGSIIGKACTNWSMIDFKIVCRSTFAISVNIKLPSFHKIHLSSDLPKSPKLTARLRNHI